MAGCPDSMGFIVLAANIPSIIVILSDVPLAAFALLAMRTPMKLPSRLPSSELYQAAQRGAIVNPTY